MDAENQIAERRFSGAVFTEQAVNLAGVERQRYLIDGLNTAKALGRELSRTSMPRLCDGACTTSPSGGSAAASFATAILLPSR